MKSAYELAMERLEKESGPTRKLTNAQRARIGDIEKRYEAKIAEANLSFESRLRSVETKEDFDKIQAELSDRIASLEAQREKEKEAVWDKSE